MGSRQEVGVEQIGICRLAGGFHLREGGEGCLASRWVGQTRAERLQRIPDARLPVDQGSVGVEGQYRKVAEAHGGISQGCGKKSAENLHHARERSALKKAQELAIQIICAIAKRKKSCVYTRELVV